MLWVKAFHIVFVVSWYAGLLYLPRLFVYHAATEDERGLERFEIMERKLFGIMTIGAVGSVVLGGWLLSPWWNVLSSTYWLQVKLVLVLGLIAYHWMCGGMVRTFAVRKNTRSPRFYRLFNEVPALILIAVSILVVVKPF